MSIPKLTTILETSQQYTNNEVEDYIPVDKQLVFTKLAELFQSKISYLYLDPDELSEELGVGSPETWEEFMNVEPVRLYVAARTKNLTQIHARKSLANLQKSANKGDVASIKYLNEISGILQAQAGNKTIVLHYVPRPQTAEAYAAAKTKEE